MAEARKPSKTAMAKQDRQALGLLCLTLLLGLMLRGAGIGWSLPDARHPLATYHPDELVNLMAAQQADIPHLQFDIQFYSYGTFYFYLVSFAHTLGHGWGLIPTTPPNTDAFSPQAVPEQAALFLAGRIVTMLLGTATIAVIYALGRRLFGRKAGLAAALIYAVTPMAVQHAHFLTVDVPATFFVSLALLWAARLLTRQTWADYILAGVWVGLAAATKYTAVLVFIAPLLAHRLNKIPNTCQTHRAAHFFVFLTAVVFAFLIACPGPIINWDVFWNGTYPGSGVHYELFVHSREGHGDLFTNTGLGWVYHLVVSLRYGLGTPLLLFSLAGLGYSLWRRKPEDAILLGFILLYYGLSGFSAVRFARYMIPLFPALSVLAGRLAVVSFPRRIIGKLPVLAAAFVIAATFFYTSLLVLQFVDKDPRDRAADYLEKNTANGASIAFAKIPWFYSPPLSPLFGELASEHRADAAQSMTRFHLRMPAQEWDTAVLSPTPDYFIISDTETSNAVDRLHEPDAVRFMQALKAANLHKIERFGPVYSPFQSEMWQVPEDMRYPAPTLTLYQKNK